MLFILNVNIILIIKIKYLKYNYEFELIVTIYAPNTPQYLQTVLSVEAHVAEEQH